MSRIKRTMTIGATVLVLGATFIVTRISFANSALVPNGPNLSLAQAVVQEPEHLPIYKGTSISRAVQFPVGGDAPTWEKIQAVKKANGLASDHLLVPGILHVSTEKQILLVNLPTLQGKPIPRYEKIDEWIRIGAGGGVIESVTIANTGDPQTSQTVVYRDGFTRNLSFPFADTEEKTERLFSTDFGFSKLFEPGALSELSYVEAADLIHFSRLIEFGEPVQNLKGPGTSAIRDIYTFSKANNALYSIARNEVRGGIEIEVSVTNYLAVEKLAEFPVEIKAILDNK